MARSEFVAIAIISVIAAISIQQAFALTCWDCSWDSQSPQIAPFCKDPFDAKNISETNKIWAYKSCSVRPGVESVHCRKTVELVNNATVISRSCFSKLINASKELCTHNTLSSIKTEFCELCDADGCNAATQLGSFALFITISFGLLQIFAF